MRMENIFGKFDITSLDMQYNRILKINMGRAMEYQHLYSIALPIFIFNMGRAMEYQHLYVLASHLFNIGVR